MLTKMWFSIFVLAVLFCQFLEYKKLTNNCPSYHDEIHFLGFAMAIFGPWVAIYLSNDYFCNPVYEFIYSLLPQDTRAMMEITAMFITFVVCLFIAYAFIFILASIDYIKTQKKRRG